MPVFIKNILKAYTVAKKTMMQHADAPQELKTFLMQYRDKVAPEQFGRLVEKALYVLNPFLEENGLNDKNIWSNVLSKIVDANDGEMRSNIYVAAVCPELDVLPEAGAPQAVEISGDVAEAIPEQVD